MFPQGRADVTAYSKTDLLDALRKSGINEKSFLSLNFSSTYNGYSDYVNDIARFSQCSDLDGACKAVRIASVVTQELRDDPNLKKLLDDLNEEIRLQNRVRGNLEIIAIASGIVVPLIIIGYHLLRPGHEARVDHEAIEKMIEEFKLPPKEAVLARALLKSSAQNDKVLESILEIFSKKIKKE